MEVIQRILRVIRANFNSLISNAEDPEKILETAFMEMQENLVQLRQGVAQAIATQKRTERQAAAGESQGEEWYRRAQLALQQGNESLAREALTKRKFYQETATTLISQIQQQKDVVAKLKQDMRTLELKLAEIKTKKDMYIARARSAEASYRLQEMLTGTSTTSSLGALERMEEKVLQIEAQSEAMSQLGSDDLEKRFASLDSYNDIDTELATMKTDMLDQGENPQPHINLPKTPEP
ncbi:MAG: PspA/IM30 family protein [Dolichospermum sp. DET50]|jgi:phage shock protein A|nr:PspA/IM30 family protein [Dolichospermum sp. DET66]MBS3030968.1 PspA/IM30 family protein [Dolichospermum sp. DET67]MBS3036178.1 PspA/IM30 family protein [Dolichospermum sp. DET50]QSX68252.1 MAG: PspA/IM30 family protein [Dolichospermum sp. DET69]